MIKGKEKKNKILDLGNDEKIEFVKLHFVDVSAKSYFLSYRIEQINYENLESAITLPNLCIPGLDFYNKQIFLKPDVQSAFIDPFSKQKTLIINCSLVTKAQDSTVDYSPISFDLRSIVRRAEGYLIKSGISTSIEFNILMEFFIFDKVEFMHSPSYSFFSVSPEGDTQKKGCLDDFAESKNSELRNEIISVLKSVGLDSCMHFVKDGIKGAVSFTSSGSMLTADKIQIAKYIIKNVAAIHRKTATFMPKPIESSEGASLYIGHSLYLDNKSIFQCPKHRELSEKTMHYITGILTSSRKIFALTNPSTNSYKRLNLENKNYIEFQYASENLIANSKYKKITSDDLYLSPHFPDSSANPYLSIASLLLAGIDGILNKVKFEDIDIGHNKVSLSCHEQNSALSLMQSLEELDRGRKVLKAKGVFDDVFIDNYIQIKRKESNFIELSVSPAEFATYS